MSGLGKGFENKYLLLAFQKSKSMKLKSTLLLIHLLICAFVSTAQQPTRPEVERSGNYYFGAGVATD
jgi:hypothetical protein